MNVKTNEDLVEQNPVIPEYKKVLTVYKGHYYI